MSSLNEHHIIGHLGKDPEFRQLENDNCVVTFSVATSVNWTDRNTGEKKQKTVWHNIVMWGKPAQIAHKYCKKGSKVYLCGPSETRSWDDKEGNKRYTTETIANKIILLDNKNDSSYRPPTPPVPEQYTQQNSETQTETSDEQPDLDDLPF